MELFSIFFRYSSANNARYSLFVFVRQSRSVFLSLFYGVFFFCSFHKITLVPLYPTGAYLETCFYPSAKPIICYYSFCVVCTRYNRRAHDSSSPNNKTRTINAGMIIIRSISMTKWNITSIYSRQFLYLSM